MEKIETKELIDCYNKILEYLKTLETKKAEVEKSMENAK